MKQILSRHLFISARLIALTMIASTITVIHSSGAVAAEFDSPNGETSFFQEFSDYLGFQSLSQADTIESDLLKVTSDAMEGSLMLKIVTDMNSSLQELKYVTSANVILDMHLDDLAKGVVLLRSGNYDVLKLVGRDLNPETGGNLDLIYLSNGVWNSYQTFPISLTRVEQVWNFQTRESGQSSTTFNMMYLKKRTLFGKTVGIESVTVSTAS